MSVLNSVDNSAPSSFVFYPVEPSAKKWSLTALAIVILMSGVLGVSYGICGFTPLVHSWRLLTPLAAMNTLKLSIFIASWGLVSVVAIIALILIYKKGELLASFVSPQIIEALDELKVSLPREEIHIEEVKKFLQTGYSTYLENYGFYYHLCCVTEKVISDPRLKKKWSVFLKQIHGTTLIRKDGGRILAIDCCVEMARLEGKLPQITIEELKNSALNLEEDLHAINRIFVDAFPGWEYGENGNCNRYFFQNGNRPFVLRNTFNSEILGVVILQERMTEREGKILFIHSLARQAAAVKMGLTEALKHYLLKEGIDLGSYAKIVCEVLKDNEPAQYIYKKLGFKIIDQTHDAYIMVYEPIPKGTADDL